MGEKEEMNSKQQIAVGVDVTASGTHITLVAPTDTGHMEVIYSEFHPMPPAQRQRAQETVPDEPTPEMEAAAEKYWNERRFSAFSNDPRTWRGLYQAMRAAAPTVKAEQVQCEVQRLRDECEYLANENIELKMLIKNMRQQFPASTKQEVEK